MRSAYINWCGRRAQSKTTTSLLSLTTRAYRRFHLRSGEQRNRRQLIAARCSSTQEATRSGDTSGEFSRLLDSRMKLSLGQHLLPCSLIALFLCAWRPGAKADPVPVRHVEGTIRGFLELRAEDGRVVASGDITRVARGDRITSRIVFHFKDGSIDDETTVFSQHRVFQLITDRHIQKGPSFPHPMDVLVDARSGQVTVRFTGKDGKDEVKSEHLDLPPDLANGMIPALVENLRPDAPA